MENHITNNSNERVYITNKESRDDVQLLRANYDAILTGTNTFLNDNPRMNVRLDFVVNQPEKILISTSFNQFKIIYETPFFKVNGKKELQL